MKEIWMISIIFIVVFIVEVVIIIKFCKLVEDFIELAIEQNALANKTYRQNMDLCREKNFLIQSNVNDIQKAEATITELKRQIEAYEKEFLKKKYPGE